MGYFSESRRSKSCDYIYSSEVYLAVVLDVFTCAIHD